MTERKGIGDSLKEIIGKAWSAFEDPEHQKKLELERKASEASVAQAERTRRWSELRRRRVPSAIADLVVDGALKRTDALDETRARLDRLVVVLAGNPGCGKTVAACSRLEERSSGQLIRASELVELSSDWGDRHKLRELRSVGVLLLDDLGVEYRDAKMASRLDDILDARISAKLPTMITTNLTAKTFEIRYGRRVWSRLAGHGAYVELDAEDMRVTPIGSGRGGP